MFDFLANKFSSIFTSLTGTGKLTEQNMQEALDKVQEALLEADVPHGLIQAFIADIKAEAVGKKVLSSVKPGEQLIKIVHEKLKIFLGGQNTAEFSFSLPATVMVLGLQGSGKTTSIAKMAYWVQEQAKKRGKTRRILFGSVDFYRPAAVDQLEILAKQVGASFYRASSTNPVIAAQEIQAHAKKEFFELVFLDTAGRLHIDNHLLQEIRDIDTKISPRYKILVVDAMTGQESLNVAQAFESGVGYHMAVMTKMDSETRGGAAFAFRYAQKKPVIFVGSGEKIADLELFHPDRMAGRILGMGDIVSLVEKAENTIHKAEQEKMYQSLAQGKFTLQDFANQIAMVNTMGSLSQVMKYLPGLASANVSPDMISKGEVELRRFRAIISSMTLKERVSPAILDASRKQRIAKGAGVGVSDVNLLLERFEQSQQYAKLFKKLWRGPKGL